MSNWGIYSYGAVLTLGILSGLYYFWKMGREEHLEEISLFDAYFLSLFGYHLFGRVGYYLLNTETLDSFVKIFALLAYPGLNPLIGIIGASAVMTIVTYYKQWNLWKIVDLAAVSLSLTLVFGMIANLISHLSSWISSSVAVVWAVSTFVLVRNVKINFRFFEWYKQGASMAKEGLAAMMFVISAGLYLVGATIVMKAHFVLVILGIIMILTAGYGIINRAGKRR